MADEEKDLAESQVTVTEDESAPESDEITFDMDEDVKGAEEAAPKEEAKEEAEEEKKAAAPSPQELQERLTQQQQQISNLNKALHEERKTRQKAKEETQPVLSKEQLRKLWTEHQDDPSVLFNILEYMADQSVKKGKEDAVTEAELFGKKKDIDGFMTAQYPELYKEGSEIRGAIDKTKQELNIADHPFSDMLAMGVQTMMNLPAVIQIYEAAKAEAQKTKADATRKEGLKKSGTAPKGKGAPVLPPENVNRAAFDEVSQRLNMSPRAKKVYAQILKKKPSQITVEG